LLTGGRLPVDEGDLPAWVDGRLTGKRAAAVEAYLRRIPSGEFCLQMSSLACEAKPKPAGLAGRLG
jgi:hypothetical protein